MKGKLLYPNVHHFELAKAMPLCPIGSHVQICDVDGQECLFVGEIELPLDIAIRDPSFFIAITYREFEKIVHQRTIEYWTEKGKSIEDAERLWNLL